MVSFKRKLLLFMSFWCVCARDCSSKSVECTVHLHFLALKCFLCTVWYQAARRTPTIDSPNNTKSHRKKLRLDANICHIIICLSKSCIEFYSLFFAFRLTLVRFICASDKIRFFEFRTHSRLMELILCCTKRYGSYWHCNVHKIFLADLFSFTSHSHFKKFKEISHN